ncbi:MAG: hypothetical protein ACREEK_03515 [Bradyrhizobium sp.]
MTYNPNDPYRANLTDDEFRRQARLNSLDNEIQADPELGDGASGAKIAMFAIAIAVVMGALFYGLNNTSVNQAGTEPTTKSAQTTPANPAAPPGMRDVTPKSNGQPGMTNGQPGMTTGAAPARPAPAPAAPAAPTDNAPGKQ